MLIYKSLSPVAPLEAGPGSVGLMVTFSGEAIAIVGQSDLLPMMIDPIGSIVFFEEMLTNLTNK